MALRNAIASTSRLPALTRAAANFFPGEPNLDPGVETFKYLKPRSRFHYTGEPQVQDVINILRQIEIDVRTQFRNTCFTKQFMGTSKDTFDYLGIQGNDPVPIPSCLWASAFDLGMKLSCPVNEEQRSRIVTALERLRLLLGEAAVYDAMFRMEQPATEKTAAISMPDALKRKIVSAIEPFIVGRGSVEDDRREARRTAQLARRDAEGRIAARGRAKSARATVWIIPTHEPLGSATSLGAEPPVGGASSSDSADKVDAFIERVQKDERGENANPVDGTDSVHHEDVPAPLDMYGLSSEPTIGRVLINNGPIVEKLADIHARNVVLEPFTLTQTLGQYNVFAIVTEGGRSSKARAVAHAIARCLHFAEGDKAKEILENSGLLDTDPRVRLRSMPNRFGHRVRRRVSGRPGRRKRNTRKRK